MIQLRLGEGLVIFWPFWFFWVPGNSGSCPQLDEEKSKHTAVWLSKMVWRSIFSHDADEAGKWNGRT